MGRDVLFNRFDGLQDGDRGVLTNYTDYEGRIPDELVPIGEDIFNNQICIDVSDAGNGRVFSWFHEGNPGEDGWGNIFLVANSFTDMCRQLFKDETPTDEILVGRICMTRPA